MKKFVVFGAGKLGMQTVLEYGKENISYIIDNDEKKQGKDILGIEIVCVDMIRNADNSYIVLIPYGGYALEAIEQLKKSEINNYRIVMNRRFNKESLIVNPYQNGSGISYDSVRTEYNRKLTDEYAKCLYKETPIFDTIEIETYNRCNGLCDFCPVSVYNDTRAEAKMTEVLFNKIIDELVEIQYSGAICLHSNNEPFMDDRIIGFAKKIRMKLPRAYTHLYTNGTLLTLEKFLEIIPNLDELIIDNYNDDLILNKRTEEIKKYCECHEELISKVTIVLRKQHEILTSRGGDAPNTIKDSTNLYENNSCILPFKQMIVRPSGQISLCCNDPLGKYTLGDLNTQSVLEVWNGVKYKEFRSAIINGRKNLPKCKLCDVFY